MPTMYIRAPDHLGDGVMALPAIHALMALGPVSLEGPPWAEALYGTHTKDHPRHDIAVLFKPSFSAAWRARKCRRRIGVDWDHRGVLLTDRVPAHPGHRVDEYATIATAAGAKVEGLPSYTGHAACPVSLPEDFTLLLPMTKSAKTAGWRQFQDLARSLSGPVVFAAGPGEESQLAAIAGAHLQLPALSLPALAQVARSARAVVGNDSGLTHLCAAAIRGAGQDVSKVHVVYGSTDPNRTGPPGTRPHRLAPLACWPCYKKRCKVASVAPCLEVSVQSVCDAVVAS